MPAGVSKDLGKQVARRVDNFGVRRKVGGGGDEAAKPDETLNAIERPQLGLDVGQQVRDAHSCRLLGLFQRDSGADDARVHQLPLTHRQHPGAKEKVMRSHHGNVTSLRCGRSRKIDS